MRPEALRAATARAARSRKLSTRLSKGEKRGRKRMAELAAVYDLTPSPRTAGDIIIIIIIIATSTGGSSETATATTGSPPQPQPQPQPGPRARGKWLTASRTRTTAQVIAAVFDQAEHRDPAHARPGVALVGGNAHQIECFHTEADRRGLRVSVSWTSCTSWSTCGKRPGASTARATRRRDVGRRSRPAHPARPPGHRRRSDPPQGHDARPGPHPPQERRHQRDLT